MKNHPLITALLAAIAVVLFAAGALLGAVVETACDPSLYMGQSRAAVAAAYGLESDEDVSAAIGLTREAQATLAARIAQGMREETLPALEPLSERENQHMQDVHALVRLAARLRAVLITAASLCCVAAAWTGAGLARRHRAALLGALGGAGALALLGVGVALSLRLFGFDALFRGLHELLFDNDLWLLDPATDVLIRMMPQLLFERAALDALARAAVGFAAGLAMGVGVYGLLGGLMRRHLTERST